MNVRALALSAFSPAFLGQCFVDDEAPEAGGGDAPADDPIEAGTEPGDPGHPAEDDDTPVDIDRVRPKAAATADDAPLNEQRAKLAKAPPAPAETEETPAEDPLAALGIQGFDPLDPPAAAEPEAPPWVQTFMQSQAAIAQQIAEDRRERAQWTRQIQQAQEMQRAKQVEAQRMPQPPPEDAPLTEHIKYARESALYEAQKQFDPIRESLNRFLQLDEQAHAARQQELERARQEAMAQQQEALLSDAINKISTVPGYDFLKDDFGNVMFRAAYEKWTQETGRRPEPQALARRMQQFLNAVASPAVRQNQEQRNTAKQVLRDKREQLKAPKPGAAQAAKPKASLPATGKTPRTGYPEWAKTEQEKRAWRKTVEGKLSLN